MLSNSEKLQNACKSFILERKGSVKGFGNLDEQFKAEIEELLDKRMND